MEHPVRVAGLFRVARHLPRPGGRASLPRQPLVAFEVGGQDPGRAFRCAFGAAIPIACLGIAAVFIPDALVPCAASLFRGYALVLSSFSGDEVGEGLVGVNVKIVAAALGGAGALLVLGWRIKKRAPCVATALVGLLRIPLALSLTLAGREQWVYQAEGFQSLLFFERAVNLGSGVSPFVPVILLTAIVIFWAWSQLRRITYAERFWGPPLAVRADADDSGPLVGTARTKPTDTPHRPAARGPSDPASEGSRTASRVRSRGLRPGSAAWTGGPGPGSAARTGGPGPGSAA